MHVTESDILLYLEDGLPPEARKQVESHIGKCRECSTLFSALARIPIALESGVPFQIDQATLSKASALVPKQSSPRWLDLRSLLTPFRVAIASMAAFVLAIVLYTFRSADEPAQFRAPETVAPALKLFPDDGSVVRGKSPSFRWSGLLGSSAYRFSLMDDRGVVVWATDVRDTAVILPPSIVLYHGKVYLWRVESFTADRSLERSRLHAFTYEPLQ